MNPNWKKFLLAQHAHFEDGDRIFFPTSIHENNQHIYPVPDLAVLSITGKDAAILLQGQITCNIHDITETQGSLGAMCNPKGRAISTFLLIKTANAFLMLVPKELLETVKKKLQMYILRADVRVSDSSEAFCLIGLYHAGCSDAKPQFASTQQNVMSIKLAPSEKRYLYILPPEQAGDFWTEQIREQGFQPNNSDQWRYLDIITGIPWLSKATSEEFIPQMLNLDKLGGISFSKGCYTGQEIVARTHYLGKIKREMFLAECATQTPPKANAVIIAESQNAAEQDIGRVIQAQVHQQVCKMLVVMQVTEPSPYHLKLKDSPQDKISLLTL
jgi:tRNA-modifying protein YgfZ